jgi:hypothetical protein
MLWLWCICECERGAMFFFTTSAFQLLCCVCVVCVFGRAKMYVEHCIMCAHVCLQSLLLLLLKQQSRRGKDWFGKHQGILWLQKAAEKDQEAQNLLASLSCTHPNLVIFDAFHFLLIYLSLHYCAGAKFSSLLVFAKMGGCFTKRWEVDAT